MNFYNPLLAIIIVASLFSSNAFSMDEDDPLGLLNKANYSSTSFPKNEEGEKEKCYSHWGLSHWFAGIGEYLGRSICCSAKVCGYDDAKRKYKIVGGYRGTHGTDCCLISEYATCNTPGHPCACTCSGVSCCDISSDGCSLTNNPITGLVCLPFAVVSHLCCLPCACCDVGENTTISSAAPVPTYYPSYGPTPSMMPYTNDRPLSCKSSARPERM